MVMNITFEYDDDDDTDTKNDKIFKKLTILYKYYCTHSSQQGQLSDDDSDQNMMESTLKLATASTAPAVKHIKWKLSITCFDWIAFSASTVLNIGWIMWCIDTTHTTTSIKMLNISNYLYTIFSSLLMIAFNISAIICSRWIFQYLNILHRIDIKLKFLRFAPNYIGFIFLILITFAVLYGGLLFMVILLCCNNFQLNVIDFAFKILPTIQLSLIISAYIVLMFLVYVRFRNLNQAFQYYFINEQNIYVADKMKLIEKFTEMHGLLTDAVRLVNCSFSIHVSIYFISHSSMH